MLLYQVDVRDPQFLVITVEKWWRFVWLSSSTIYGSLLCHMLKQNKLIRECHRFLKSDWLIFFIEKPRFDLYILTQQQILKTETIVDQIQIGHWGIEFFRYIKHDCQYIWPFYTLRVALMIAYRIIHDKKKQVKSSFIVLKLASSFLLSHSL